MKKMIVMQVSNELTKALALGGTTLLIGTGVKGGASLLFSYFF